MKEKQYISKSLEGQVSNQSHVSLLTAVNICNAFCIICTINNGEAYYLKSQFNWKYSCHLN